MGYLFKPSKSILTRCHSVLSPHMFKSSVNIDMCMNCEPSITLESITKINWSYPIVNASNIYPPIRFSNIAHWAVCRDILNEVGSMCFTVTMQYVCWGVLSPSYRSWSYASRDSLSLSLLKLKLRWCLVLIRLFRVDWNCAQLFLGNEQSSLVCSGGNEQSSLVCSGGNMMCDWSSLTPFSTLE
jgi:hypothetical protein